MPRRPRSPPRPSTSISVVFQSMIHSDRPLLTSTMQSPPWLSPRCEPRTTDEVMSRRGICNADVESAWIGCSGIGLPSALRVGVAEWTEYRSQQRYRRKVRLDVPQDELASGLFRLLRAAANVWCHRRVR